MRTVPRHGVVDECEVRPLDDRLPAGGRAHGAAAGVRGLPQEQQLQHHGDDVRFVPPDGLQHCEVARRSHRLPNHVRRVPRHRALDGWQVRSRDHRVPAGGRAHGAAAGVRGLPQEQQLQHHGDHVHFVPSGRLYRRDLASAAHGLPDHV